MEWKKLSHIEHILVRPDSYVGSLVPGPVDTWRLAGDKFERHTVHIAPALVKIFDEILVNAIDQHTLHPRKVSRIDISWKKDGTVTIRNNGDGIPIKKHATENIWIPELIFGHLLTSSNYDDSQERMTGGRNGYGAKLTNVFSKRFTIRVGTKYSQMWHDNMTRMDEPLIHEKGHTEGVEIEFLPDWLKFGQVGPSQDFFEVVTRRTWDAAMWCQKARVTLNGEHIKIETLEDYAHMHTQGPLVSLGKDIVIGHSECGKFEQISYVNGIATLQGGTHIDRFVNQLIAALPVKDVRPAQVKASLWVFMRASRDRPTFSSQTKTECTSKDTTDYVFRPATTKAIMACGIADDLAALEMAKSEKILNKTNGTKRSKVNIPKLDDANWAGTARSSDCTLIITEGDSAKTLAVSGLSVVGRDRYGIFPLRGKPRNVRDASVKQLSENEEFSNLKKILGLQHGKTYTNLKELRYGRLMIMTDADKDGTHIKGLVLNMVHHFWPELIQLGFVTAMITPVIKVGSKWFFTETAYKSSGVRGQVKYYKGLGTSTSAEAKEYFKSIDQLTVAFQSDEHTDDSIALAFAKAMTDKRKSWLVGHMKTPQKCIEYGTVNCLSVTDFVNRDLIFFSAEDIHRSIPHVMDGFKPSQRKVLYATLKRGIKTDMKVAQLAGYVAEVTAYHHGESSLQGTIIGLAQNFIGSNNINLLEPSGQFGTRLMGGKDAASSRYIFTRLSEVTRHIFHPDDEDVLHYVVDDGQQVEPEWYAPVVPMVLVNGAEGIGTGFSCYVPPYKIDDVIKNIKCALDGKPMIPMVPYFKGFTGSIERKNEHTWTLNGTVTEHDGCMHVTELPPGLWISDFKEHLDTLIEKGTITKFENYSTETKADFKIWGGNIESLNIRRFIHTSNMYLVGPKGIRKYASPEEILIDYMETRIKVYSRRRAHLLEKCTSELSILNHKLRFIQMVISGSLVVFRRPIKDIQVDLKRYEFPDGLWNMLMDTKTSHYTNEEIERLYEKVKSLEKNLEFLKMTSVPSLWKQNLDKL
jgi:DNA topoisomerase-2